MKQSLTRNHLMEKETMIWTTLNEHSQQETIFCNKYQPLGDNLPD